MIWCWRRCEAEHSISKEQNWFNKSENLIRPWFDKINNAPKLNWNCAPFEVEAVKSKSTFYSAMYKRQEEKITRRLVAVADDKSIITKSPWISTNCSSCFPFDFKWFVYHPSWYFLFRFNGDFERKQLRVICGIIARFLSVTFVHLWTHLIWCFSVNSFLQQSNEALNVFRHMFFLYYFGLC